MENKSNDLEDLRNHIRTSIYEIRQEFSRNQNSHNEYAFKLKSWGLTLFIASLAFCVQEEGNIGNLYYFLPFIPVFFFWFLYAYQFYNIERYKKTVGKRKLTEALANLYNYDYDKLKDILKDIYVKKDWPDKGRFRPKRFIKEKIPKILYFAIINASNLLFFGSMVLIWAIFIVHKLWIK
jgi:hypothetical protein